MYISKNNYIKKVFIFIPIIIISIFILRLNLLMDGSHIQHTDSSIFVTKALAQKEFGQLWQFANLGNRNFSESTNFYSRLPSYILLSLNVPTYLMQLIFYFVAFNLIFYISWFFFYKIIKLYTDEVTVFYASFISALFYTFNIQMALFWGGGLGDAMYFFLFCIPIFTYLILKSLQTTLTIETILLLSLLVGLNANVISLNLAFFGVMIFSFLLTDGLLKLPQNMLKIFFILMPISLLVGAIFIYPISMVFAFPDPNIPYDPLKQFIFSNNGINGLYQLFFNWTTKLVWADGPVFPTSNYYTHPLGILSIFTIWIITLATISSNLGNLRKFNKLMIFIFCTLFLSFFLAKGDQRPLGDINLFLYDEVPLFGLFRTPDTKFGISVIVILSILIGFSLQLIRKPIFKVILISVVIIHIFPFFTAINFVGLENDSKLVKIPNEYLEVADIINNDNEMGYVMIYPGYFYEKFDYKNDTVFSGQDILGKLISKPVVYNEYTRILQNSKDLLKSFDTNLDNINPGEYSIKYIIVHRDIINIDVSDDLNKLNINPHIEKIYESQLVSVYEVDQKSYKSLYSFQLDGVNIDKQIIGDLNKYDLNQKFTIPSNLISSNSELTVVMNTSNHALLKPVISTPTELISHTVYKQFANKWQYKLNDNLNTDDTIIRFNYEPQANYLIAIGISIISIITIIGYLIINKIFKSQMEIFIRDIILSFIFTPVRIISSFIPKDKSIIVFGSWMGKNFSDNPYFFYEHLLENHSNLKLIIVTKNQATIDNLSAQGKLIYHQYSFKGLWYVARANTLAITHSVKEDINVITVSPKQVVIQFWHGTPVKTLSNLGYLKQNNYHNLITIYGFLQKLSSAAIPANNPIIAANQFTKDIFVDFFNVKPDVIKIFGYPRNDIFYKYKPLKVSQSKILIYLPTYRNKVEESSPIISNLEEINNILQKKNYLMLIKPHPAVSKSVDLKELSNIKTQFEVMKTNDAQVAMAKSDVLISDYSGLIHDFSLTDKPFIFFPYDYNEYVKSPGICIDYYNDLPGKFAHKISEFINLIDTIEKWEDEKSYRVKYKKYKNKFHKYQDGNSSERLYNYLVDNSFIEKT